MVSLPVTVQFLKVGWKIVMHGDDTWLKLFPGLFSRHDGVSSFFVSLFNSRKLKHSYSVIFFSLLHSLWCSYFPLYTGLAFSVLLPSFNLVSFPVYAFLGIFSFIIPFDFLICKIIECFLRLTSELPFFQLFVRLDSCLVCLN